MMKTINKEWLDLLTMRAAGCRFSDCCTSLRVAFEHFRHVDWYLAAGTSCYTAVVCSACCLSPVGSTGLWFLWLYWYITNVRKYRLENIGKIWPACFFLPVSHAFRTSTQAFFGLAWFSIRRVAWPARSLVCAFSKWLVKLYPADVLSVQLLGGIVFSASACTTSFPS